VAIPVNEIIKFVNEYSQLVLEIEGEAIAEGTRAEQYTDTGKDHQRWRLRPTGIEPANDDFYYIENVHSAMSLEVVNYSKELGAEIVQRPYGDGPLHRQWKLVPVPEKTDVYKIENRNSGLVLDDVGGQKEAPAPVRQYGSWNDDGRQQWKLIRVPTAKITTTGKTTTGKTTTGTSGTAVLYAWGYNGEGQLGDGTYAEQLGPQKNPYLTRVGIEAISAGGSHSLALLENGTVQAWGSQDYYQLGNPTYADRLEPGEVLGLKAVKAISAGGWHNLALLEDRTVRAWGLDNEGQLGDGTVSGNQYQPPVKVVDLEGVTAVSAGGRHSLALLGDGTVWAWGSQDWYQLGNPTYIDLPRPKKVLDLEEVHAIAAGPWHSLALLRDGTVRGWGANNYGQLGGGTATGNQYQPPVTALDLKGAKLIPVDRHLKAIAAGSHHSLALMKDGTVWAWGYNGYGQLGDGTKTDRHRPVQVPDFGGVTAIAAGRLQGISHNSFALREDGTVWAWGYNGYGQLGDGTKESRDRPVKVLELKRVKEVDAGGYHSLAVT
jgi:alpha-tubulin suppressor-like RCC1 family protein